MCGIFGSTEKQKFITLYNLNKKRGNFAVGTLFLNQSTMVVRKYEGVVEPVKLFKNEEDVNCKMYLGHTQAPTSAKREYSFNTSHPFEHGDWIVSHNGVLTNFNEIKNEFDFKWKNPVDSSIIPLLFSSIKKYSKNYEEQDVICSALSLLEGTFGLWIVNKRSAKTYIARCGSTLFADIYSNTFSSVNFSESESLEEGALYHVTPEGLTTVGNFDYNSPFST
jgi:glucosamine 6-phosphate synthetase-like amidotransferase/phosphosugar isomerase protein